MSLKTRLPKALGVVAASLLAVGAAGCSMDDVQFNGGIFDAVGLSDSARSNANSGEPKMAERAPLVVPPKLDNLPAPGEAAPDDSRLAAIHDPDEQAKVSQEELERQQAEYCEKNYHLPKSAGDDSADSVEGPLGPCRPSILTSIKKWNSGEE